MQSLIEVYLIFIYYLLLKLTKSLTIAIQWVKCKLHDHVRLEESSYVKYVCVLWYGFSLLGMPTLASS